MDEQEVYARQSIMKLSKSQGNAVDFFLNPNNYIDEINEKASNSYNLYTGASTPPSTTLYENPVTTLYEESTTIFYDTTTMFD